MASESHVHHAIDYVEFAVASLMLPAVQDAIQRGRPLIAEFDVSTTTQPVGGYGIPQQKAR